METWVRVARPGAPAGPTPRNLDGRPAAPTEAVAFAERQSFLSNRVAVIAGLGAALVCGGAIYAAWRGAAATPAPMLSVVFLGAVFALLALGELRVEVRESALVVRLFPLTREHHFAWDTIRSCEARTYRPIVEYGGWGIRYGRSGKAYNVHGDRGVQLEFHDGTRLLIGSQRADALAEAIRARHAR